MNPRERFLTALRGEPTDRAPVAHVTALTTVELQRITGCFMPAVHRDPEALARLCWANHEILGLDAVTFNITYFGEPAALGSAMDWGSIDTYPNYGPPIWHEPEDAVIPVDLLDREPICTYLAATRLAQQRYGDRVAVLAKIMGPLSMVQALHGVDATMMDLVGNPERVRALLDVAVEVLARCAVAEVEAGADAIAIGEGGAGGNMLSPRMHREFLHDMHRRLVAQIPAPAIMHICGDITPRIDALIDSGIACFNLDWAVDPALMKEKVGGAFTLMGNINTTDLLLGTPEEIERQVIHCLKSGIDIISPGCAISPRCPNANLQAMVATDASADTSVATTFSP
jgi:[methyl-Co(III) methanol-specific corrinoid protein]:coenzyme M methyltransferase